MPLETARSWIEEGILVVKAGTVPQKKIYLNPEGVRCRDVWTNVETLQKGETTRIRNPKAPKAVGTHHPVLNR